MASVASSSGSDGGEDVENSHQSPSKPEHPIRHYFSYDNDRKKSRCILGGCSDKKNPDEIIEFQGQQLGNLKRHLRRKHTNAFKRFEAEEKEYQSKVEDFRRTKKGKLKAKSNSMVMTQREIKRNLMRLIAVRGRPLALMDDPEFQALMVERMNGLPPEERFRVNSSNVRAFCGEEADRIRKSITEELKGKLVCLKVDSCTKGQRPFFAINAQFIAKWTIQIRTLCVKEMMLTQQLAVNLKREIQDTASEYGVPLENIYSLSSDNGGNMILTGRLIGHDQEDGFDDEDVLEGEKGMADGCLLTGRDIRCQSVRCAAHSLQLAVECSLKACPEAVKVISQVRQRAVALRTPNKRKELKMRGLAVPVLDNATRWGTKDDMLQSVVKLKEYISGAEDEAAQPNEDDEEVDKLDWDKVDAVIAALAPAKEATIQLQAEQLTLGDFLYIWNRCKSKLKDLELHNNLAEELVRKMDQFAEKRVYKSGPNKNEEKWPHLFEYPAALAAIFMDPRYFVFLSEDQKAQAINHLKKLWLRIQAAKKSATNNGDDHHDEIAPDQQDPESDDSDNEFARELRRSNAARLTSTAGEEVEISVLLQKFIAETPLLSRKKSVLKFWEEKERLHPELAELACVALAVPATQVSVERLFSSLRFMLDPLRMRLTGAFVEELLIIRNNSIMMEK